MNVKLVSFSSFFTVRPILTFTSAAVKPLHTNATVKVWEVVGIVPDDDMFNCGGFKATASDDSTEIVYVNYKKNCQFLEINKLTITHTDFEVKLLHVKYNESILEGTGTTKLRA